jgi:hypothetical protein
MIRRSRLLAILLAAAPACAARPPPAQPPASSEPIAGLVHCDGVVTVWRTDTVEVQCDAGFTTVLSPGAGLEMPWLDVGERVRAEYWDASGVATTFYTEDGYELHPSAPGSQSQSQDPGQPDQGCFITTAVARARGLPDDCDALSVLRDYRDRYLAGHPDVVTYYAIAPAIVRAISARPDSATIWRVLFEDYLAPIISMVRAGRDAEAHAAYRTMVADLGGQNAQ